MTTTLEDIKVSLSSNANLPQEVKQKLYELVVTLNKKLPEVNLNKLNEKIKTVKIGKISKYERKGTYNYNVFKNEILFSNNLEGNYDIDHLLMKALLEMSTSTGTYTGFHSDDRLRALNLAYTEILANYIIGNEGDSDLEEEMLVTNLLSHIVGKDTMFNSYFTNNGEPIIKAMQDAEVGML
ncbi:MAG: hypothetical protein IJY25_05370 [Bacilli bacterium]|nr:hypothetical protein [Bacilli bacterium]